MKVVNYEFRRMASVCGGRIVADGWIVETDTWPDLFFRMDRPMHWKSAELKNIRQGVSAKAGVYSFNVNLMEFIDPSIIWYDKTSVFGTLRPLWNANSRCGELVWGSPYHPCLTGNAPHSFSSADSSCPVQVKKFLDDFANDLRESESLLQFLVSPARWHEKRQADCLNEMDRWQKKVDKWGAFRKKALDEGVKFGTQTIV